MKKGYKRLLVFQIIMIILLFLGSFVSSILGNYLKVIYLGISLILFKCLFGYEKDRHRYIKSICMELIIYLLIYFILYYLLGVLLSFARTVNYLHFNGIIKIILPILLMLIFREIYRYMMVTKSEGSKLLLTTSCIFFIIIDLFGTFNDSTFRSPYTTFIYIAITVLPIISRNVFFIYLTYKCGFKPVLLYVLVVNMYSYFVPIIPNPNQYIYSVIELVIPMLFMYKIYKFYRKERDEKVEREYNKKRVVGLIIPSLLVLFFVYITSGYFHYHAVAVASGSMEPTIYKGDVVVIEKVSDKLNIQVGQPIAYRYENIIVVHRLMKKVNVGDEVFFYTKGDANYSMDNYKITEDMILGIVNIKIPYIGYPTVWLNGL